MVVTEMLVKVKIHNMITYPSYRKDAIKLHSPVNPVNQFFYKCYNCMG
jgi:hypothetical protein